MEMEKGWSDQTIGRAWLSSNGFVRLVCCSMAEIPVDEVWDRMIREETPLNVEQSFNSHLCWMKEWRISDDGIRLFPKNIRFIRCSSPPVSLDHICHLVGNFDNSSVERVDNRERTFLQWLEDQMQKKRISLQVLVQKEDSSKQTSNSSGIPTRWKMRKTDRSILDIVFALILAEAGRERWRIERSNAGNDGEKYITMNEKWSWP